MQLAKAFVRKSELERFASNVFKLFDEDKNGFLDFGEFSLAISAQVGLDYLVTWPSVIIKFWVQETLESRERLIWMFDRVYDKVGCVFSF